MRLLSASPGAVSIGGAFDGSTVHANVSRASRLPSLAEIVT
jgi:hypothetical protein